MKEFEVVKKLSIEALDQEIVELVKGEREAQWKCVVRLLELDRRRGWADYGSLWAYCSRRLGLPDGAIFKRIRAMEVVRSFPHVIDLLREGSLWMTSLATLQPILTTENADDVFRRAAGQSTREIERLVASYKEPTIAPEPLIRRMPIERVPTLLIDVALAPAVVVAPEAKSDAPTADAPSFVTAPQPEPRRGEAKPVAANQHLIRLFVDDEFMGLLDRVGELVSHSVPSGDVTGVLRHALLEVAKKHERRLEPTRNVEAQPWDIHDAHVPAPLRREVMKRDGGRCVWEFAAGGVCGSRWQVQVDHVLAVGLGGLTILSNLRVLCRRHNLEHARRTYGDAFVEEKMAKGR